MYVYVKEGCSVLLFSDGFALLCSELDSFILFLATNRVLYIDVMVAVLCVVVIILFFSCTTSTTFVINKLISLIAYDHVHC